MFGFKKSRFNLGTVTAGTNQMIDETIERLHGIKRVWSRRRPTTLAVSNSKPEKTEKAEPIAVIQTKPSTIFKDDSKKGWKAYWFPLLCLAAVILVAIWTFWPSSEPRAEAENENAAVQKTDSKNGAKPAESDKHETKATVKENGLPAFDIVRVESGGRVVAAGRANKDESVSISVNKRIVMTIKADAKGEFVYSPKSKMKPGNYTLQLITKDARSHRVFLYIDAKPENSLSLLMTDKESRVLMAPKSVSSEKFRVTQIDYLANKRLVVQGKGVPKFRVSTSLNGKLLGMTRVSDHGNFGLGAGAGELKAGEDYTLSVKMHDSKGKTAATIEHKFKMPKMTPNDDTFYIVRRGDSLWVISRNFYGKGIRFSIIANANKAIKNPDLIYPDQKFKIPVDGK
ncbi:MAG: LysM peptidoglycan-binding domain-containing protein [Rickettsiales bacterium]|jgi:nucleoid-associated protein YgaU|nr:LysM peptidoglycan-binding domain-containing protein [Rickettsiales bacterium]